jgi:hypothetical protein
MLVWMTPMQKGASFNREAMKAELQKNIEMMQKQAQ